MIKITGIRYKFDDMGDDVEQLADAHQVMLNAVWNGYSVVVDYIPTEGVWSLHEPLGEELEIAFKPDWELTEEDKQAVINYIADNL